MRRSCWCLPSLCAAVACVVNFPAHPTVRPKDVPRIRPPIQAHALLLLVPAFEKYRADTRLGIVVRSQAYYGPGAAKALTALVRASFTTSTIRHATAEDLVTLLAGPADTSVADLLLVPSFEGIETRSRDLWDGVEYQGYEFMVDLRLRVTVTSWRSGTSFSWVGLGHTGWLSDYAVTDRTGGSLLEEALHALRDSIAAHRAALEPDSAVP